MFFRDKPMVSYRAEASLKVDTRESASASVLSFRKRTPAQDEHQPCSAAAAGIRGRNTILVAMKDEGQKQVALST